ncbi:MAG: adenylate kinase [Micrococcales bacterium]|nr:adenylate kinase [Micrococcales bacterium]
MTRVVLLGPPGSGKGTQAVGLALSLGVPTISTGAIFRANLSSGTALGVEAQKYMSAGELVPDSVTDAMVRSRLAEPDAAGGWVLDGYPRNLAQVSALDALLAESGLAVEVALELTVPEEAIVSRLAKRASIEGREDDTESVIRHRIAVYEEQTAPIASVYRSRGLLRSVDALGSVEEVGVRLLAAARGDGCGCSCGG